MQNNYAFDLSMFSESAPSVKREPKKQPDLKVVPKKEKVVDVQRQKAVKNIFCIFLAGFALFFFLSGKVTFNELDLKLNEKKTELSELQSDYTRLQMLCESKQSREKIEDYAVNVLHMQPVQDYQRKSITLEQEDKVIPLQTNEKRGILDTVGDIFS